MIFPKYFLVILSLGANVFTELYDKMLFLIRKNVFRILLPSKNSNPFVWEARRI